MVERSTRAELPDMEFIRREIPIAEVAKGLGLRVSSNTAHCWRTDHHQHGDRTASISFRKNKATCYVCDSRPLSTLDLVIVHEGFDLLDATRWICARWDVPAVAKGKKLVRSERWSKGRVGLSRFPFESLIRSGFWASLDDAARAVLPALVCFTDPSAGEAEISYKALARYSGKSSDRTISAVIKKFERIGLLKVFRAKDGTFRKCGRYQLDWENERFQAALNSCHEALKIDRDAQRALRAGGKAAALLLKSNTLFTTVKCQQSSRFSTVKREESNETEQKKLISENQDIENTDSWQTPRFTVVKCEEVDEATSFPFGWNLSNFRLTDEMKAGVRRC